MTARWTSRVDLYRETLDSSLLVPAAYCQSWKTDKATWSQDLIVANEIKTMRVSLITLLVAVTSIGSCGRTNPDAIESSRTPPRADRLAAPGSAASGPRSAVTAAAAEFEGGYQVGDTHCVATPVKMAFEVTWEKGRGTMLIFFDRHTPKGKVVFVSAPGANGEDRFVFDDDRYARGKFIRADGKEFAVSKVERR